MKTVWCNGSFDLLHPAHIELFKIAKTLAGDGKVIVGLDSDERIREKKGFRRPINTIEDRKIMLESIRYIDLVLEFDSDKGLTNLLQMIRPDIMLLGGDWRDGKVIGSEYAQEVRFFDRKNGYSTTGIINRAS